MQSAAQQPGATIRGGRVARETDQTQDRAVARAEWTVTPVPLVASRSADGARSWAPSVQPGETLWG